jgi:hypothetical protein
MFQKIGSGLFKGFSNIWQYSQMASPLDGCRQHPLVMSAAS